MVVMAWSIRSTTTIRGIWRERRERGRGGREGGREGEGGRGREREGGREGGREGAREGKRALIHGIVTSYIYIADILWLKPIHQV